MWLLLLKPQYVCTVDDNPQNQNEQNRYSCFVFCSVLALGIPLWPVLPYIRLPTCFIDHILVYIIYNLLTCLGGISRLVRNLPRISNSNSYEMFAVATPRKVSGVLVKTTVICSNISKKKKKKGSTRQCVTKCTEEESQIVLHCHKKEVEELIHYISTWFVCQGSAAEDNIEKI